MQSCGVRRPSVWRKLLRKSLLFAGKWLELYHTCKLHMIVPSPACIQGVLKVKVEVKGHVIRAHIRPHCRHFCDVTKCLLYSTVSRSVSTCAHFMKHHYTLLSVGRQLLYLMSKYWNELLRHWRSIVVSSFSSAAPFSVSLRSPRTIFCGACLGWPLKCIFLSF